MRLGIKLLAATITAGLLTLSSCTDNSQYGKPLLQTHNLDGQTFPLKVMVFESEYALNKYVQGNDLIQQDVLGLARWTVKRDDRSNVTGCTIYVVDPKGLNDSNRFETWGHELVHCVYGSFHKEAH